jgi:NADH-quinone oxidoreductase subunit H
MKWLRAILPLVAALALVWLVSGAGAFGQQPAPQLIQVVDMSPRDVEQGDVLTLVGTSFPSGKAARVTFRGALHRPGERVLRGADIALTGSVVGPDQVRVAFGETAEALFCRTGGRAVHTTFEGEVEVAFAAAAAGAPPVAGVLAGVTLDVRPGGADADADRDGERALAQLGIHAGAAAGAAGLAVESVQAGSPADAEGIAAGDVLVSLDGLRIGTLADLIPSPGAREVALGVRPAGSAIERVHTMTVGGFRRASAAELVPAVGLVLAALAVAALFAGPGRPLLGATVQRAAVAARARLEPGQRPGRGRTERGGFAAALARDVLPPAGAPALVDMIAWALLAAMPFGQYLVAARLDVAILLVAAAAALAAASLATGGAGWRGLAAPLHVFWQHAPAAIAVACVVVTTGSLRVQEIEHAQGGAPWQWLALRQPGALVAFALLLACGRAGLPVQAAAGRLSALIEGPHDAPAQAAGIAPSASSPWADAGVRAHRIVLAGLAASLFLGGWLLPGLSPAQQDAVPALQLAGAAWLLAKAAALVLCLAWARWAFPPAPLGDGSRTTALRGLPLAALAFAATAAWTHWAPSRSAQDLVSGALAALVALGALSVLARALHALSPRRTRRGLELQVDRQLSPFL